MSPSRTTRHQPRGDDPQQLVAGGVPEGVVDVLEAVDVDVQRRHRELLAPRAGEHLLRTIERQHAVGQAGQGVVQRLMAKLSGLLAHHIHSARSRERVSTRSSANSRMLTRDPPTSTSSP